MRLYRRGRTLEADTLDDIRVKRSLQQPLDLSTISTLRLELLVQSLSLLLEYLDESISNDLSLLLRVENSFQLAEEELGRVDDGEIDAEILAEHLVDLRRFVHSQNSVVDHNRVKSVASRRQSMLVDSDEWTDRSPIASCMSLAATDESTPPETAPRTRPFGPTSARIRAISLSMNAS